MIEIRHLKTLQALQDTGSVSAAAERLHLTQSALSHQIKQLERQLGFALFQRKSNPIVFTPAGQILLNTARSVLPRMEQAQAMLRGLATGEMGRLYVGVECHTCFEWLMPVVRVFQQRWPGIDLDIIPSLTRSALSLLGENKCDVVITSDPVPNPQLIFEELFRYEQLLVVNAGHPLAEKSIIEPEDLQDQTLICYPVAEDRLDVFRSFLTPAGIRPAALRFSELTLMMLALVDVGRGVCVLPRWLLDTVPEYAHLPRLRLGEDGLWSRLYAALPAQQAQLPPQQDLIRCIREQMG